MNKMAMDICVQIFSPSLGYVHRSGSDGFGGTFNAIRNYKVYKWAEPVHLCLHENNTALSLKTNCLLPRQLRELCLPFPMP